jgi:hypothetical protein
VSRPDPSPPVAHIAVSYDTDVAGAAEVLLAILAQPSSARDPETEPYGAGEDSGAAAE